VLRVTLTPGRDGTTLLLLLLLCVCRVPGCRWQHEAHLLLLLLLLLLLHLLLHDLLLHRHCRGCQLHHSRSSQDSDLLWHGYHACRHHRLLLLSLLLWLVLLCLGLHSDHVHKLILVLLLGRQLQLLEVLRVQLRLLLCCCLLLRRRLLLRCHLLLLLQGLCAPVGRTIRLLQCCQHIQCLLLLGLLLLHDGCLLLLHGCHRLLLLHDRRLLLHGLLLFGLQHHLLCAGQVCQRRPWLA
jgi:hypothetical protein